jgi:hypothetical protein
MMKAKKVANPDLGSGITKPEDNAVSIKDIRSKPYDSVKTTGVKIRGTGAATKGVTARGPMA